MAPRAAPGMRERARQLRTTGRSIQSIADELEVSKNSVSRWVRDLPLEPGQLRALLQQRQVKAVAAMRRARQRRIEAGRLAGAERCRTDPTFRAVCLLYWGEGAKHCHSFRICNGDHRMLAAVARWLIGEGYAGLMRATVYYYADTPHSDEDVLAWWSRHLGIPVNQFRPSHVKPPSGNPQHVGKLPYGVCHLAVSRAQLLREVLGGIEYLAENGL